MEEIERMQQYLLLIRRTVGWTAEEFGEKIGVTRQTINNIESGRNKLTKTQYIAMRSILDAEIARVPDETEMLKALLEILVDNPEKYSKSDREQLLSKANMIAPSILSGASKRKDVSKEWIAIAGTIVGVSAISLISPISSIAVATTATWISKILHDKNKKKKG